MLITALMLLFFFSLFGGGWAFSRRTYSGLSLAGWLFILFVLLGLITGLSSG
ncbi:MAG: hypothetical protein JNJ46_22540 [Myxococcales bacterium]|nr:hypothetical protein [Myxococcales bacterium]